MAIVHYTCLDSGAPILPSVASQRFIDNLKLILLACLVNGYGSKPAAGWSLVHEHADGFTLGNGAGYINFAAVDNQSVVVYLLETFTGSSGALAMGYNRRSGPWFDGAADSQRHYHRATFLYSTVANKIWHVVADERTAILYHNANDTIVDSATSNGGAMYFGEFFTAFGGTGFCALGGSLSSSGTPSLFRPQGEAPGTMLRNPFDGTIAQGGSPGYRAGVPVDSVNGAVLNKYVVAPGRLRLVRSSVMARGVGVSGATSSAWDAQCGVLRGVVAEPALADAYASKALAALGISSPTHLDKVRPITLQGGRQVVPLHTTSYDLGALVSLDPSDWE